MTIRVDGPGKVVAAGIAVPAVVDPRTGVLAPVRLVPLGGPADAQLQSKRRDHEFALIGISGQSRILRPSVPGGSRLAEPRSIADAVAAAARGDAPTSRAVRDQARLVALGISAVVAVLDPELEILGGEIVAIPGVLEPVRDEVDHTITESPRIETSPLGDRGPCSGRSRRPRACTAPHPEIAA